jgi:alcohol dehydrogenase class IV
MIEGFTSTGLPQMSYGRGAFSRLDQHLLSFGPRTLMISDAYMKEHPSLFDEMSQALKNAGLSFEHLSVLSTDTQENAQEILKNIDLYQFDSVVSIGGGRAIDVAKLVSRGLPHIAVPTTAGTGAAMNGVIFGGKSAHQETRLTSLLPNVVLADPAFIDDMGRVDFATRALGVFNLLLEAYISPKSSILSDAFIWSGLESFARGFVQGLDGNPSARDDVFYASLMAGAGSGQAGFGLSHRLACVIEYKSSLSYAEASATLCAEICDLQIQLLSDILPDHSAMDKYALVGELLAGRPFDACEEAYASLIGTLRRWVARLELPKLQLSEDELLLICQDICADWDEDVLPLRISEDDLLDSLLRRTF